MIVRTEESDMGNFLQWRSGWLEYLTEKKYGEKILKRSIKLLVLLKGTLKNMKQQSFQTIKAPKKLTRCDVEKQLLHCC